MENTTTYLYTTHTEKKISVPEALNITNVADISETKAVLVCAQPYSEFEIAHYEIRIDGAFHQIAFRGDGGKQYTPGIRISGLTAGTTYTITARAVNVNMHAADVWSNSITFSTTAADIVTLFKNRVLADGGTFENETALRAFAPTLDLPNTTLALFPGANKAGKSYSVVPSVATDWTVVRNTPKNRINKDGFIETMPANVLAPDYLTGVGLIKVDEQTTSLLRYGKDFTRWAKFHIGNVIPFSSSMFLGETTSYKIVEDANNNYQRINASGAGSLVVGTKYVLYVLMKADGRRYAQIYTGSNFANFDLQEGIIGNSLNIDSYSVSRVLANGFRKYAIMFTASSSSSETSIGCLMDINAPKLGTYVGDGVSGIVVQAVQLATKDVGFIETNGSVVTVNRDLVTINPPVGTTRILENKSDGTTNTIISIPANYEVSSGIYKSIIMKK